MATRLTPQQEREWQKQCAERKADEARNMRDTLEYRYADAMSDILDPAVRRAISALRDLMELNHGN